METLCDHMKIREDVGGATFMAFGGALPEICVNAICSLKQAGSGPEKPSATANLGIGAILGSGLIAFCIIPSCCAIFSKEPLALNRRPLARDVSAYLCSLGCLLFSLVDNKIEMEIV